MTEELEIVNNFSGFDEVPALVGDRDGVSDSADRYLFSPAMIFVGDRDTGYVPYMDEEQGKVIYVPRSHLEACSVNRIVDFKSWDYRLEYLPLKGDKVVREPKVKTAKDIAQELEDCYRDRGVTIIKPITAKCTPMEARKLFETVMPSGLQVMADLRAGYWKYVPLPPVITFLETNAGARIKASRLPVVQAYGEAARRLIHDGCRRAMATFTEMLDTKTRAIEDKRNGSKIGPGFYDQKDMNYFLTLGQDVPLRSNEVARANQENSRTDIQELAEAILQTNSQNKPEVAALVKENKQLKDSLDKMQKQMGEVMEMMKAQAAVAVKA